MIIRASVKHKKCTSPFLPQAPSGSQGPFLQIHLPSPYTLRYLTRSHTGLLSLPKPASPGHAPRPLERLFPLCGNAFLTLLLQRNSYSSFKTHLRSPLLFVTFLEMLSSSCPWKGRRRTTFSSFTCVPITFYMEYNLEYKLHCYRDQATYTTTSNHQHHQHLVFSMHQALL